MPRYIARPRSAAIYDDYDGTAHTADEVIVALEDDWIDSGLLDAQGRKLVRWRERERIGFRIT